MRDIYENKYHKSFCVIARETGGEECAGALPLCPSQISQANRDRVLTFSDYQQKGCEQGDKSQTEHQVYFWILGIHNSVLET